MQEGSRRAGPELFEKNIKMNSSKTAGQKKFIFQTSADLKLTDEKKI